MRLFFLKLGILIGIILLCLISFSTYKEISKKKKIQNEITKLQEEAKKINKENLDIQEKISYLESRDFQEKEARDKLNLQKPGENIVIIKPTILENNAEEKKAEGNSVQKNSVEKISTSIPLKWWNYFFGDLI